MELNYDVKVRAFEDGWKVINDTDPAKIAHSPWHLRQVIPE